MDLSYVDLSWCRSKPINLQNHPSQTLERLDCTDFASRKFVLFSLFSGKLFHTIKKLKTGTAKKDCEWSWLFWKDCSLEKQTASFGMSSSERPWWNQCSTVRRSPVSVWWTNSTALVPSWARWALLEGDRNDLPDMKPCREAASSHTAEGPVPGVPPVGYRRKPDITPLTSQMPLPQLTTPYVV